jgi:hypothetical protein
MYEKGIRVEKINCYHFTCQWDDKFEKNVLLFSAISYTKCAISSADSVCASVRPCVTLRSRDLEHLESSGFR